LIIETKGNFSNGYSSITDKFVFIVIKIIMMEIKDRIDYLVDEYTQTVLIHLFPNVNKQNSWSKECGISKNEFEISLTPESFLKCAPQYKPVSKSFLHFTSLRSLHSIINEMSIRMYNLKNVNDPNEISFSLKNLHINKPELDRFRDRIYTLSLCEPNVLDSPNILNLWRLYGHDGWGVAIEFNIEFPKNQSQSKFLLAKIIYDKMKLKSFYEASKNFEIKNKIKVKNSSLLVVPSCLHKSKYFEIENEVRLVFDGEQFPAIEVLKDDCKYKNDFNTRNEFVSYYNLGLYKDNEVNGAPEISIKRIQIGFRYDKKKFTEIKRHIENLETALLVAKLKPIQYTIERSPLKNIFR
jgi:hypothetical protein